jgi:cysteine desulfurase
VLPNTINLSFPGCKADQLLIQLDLFGIACSTGSACSSGSLLPSPVLKAMGVPQNVLNSAMRFSFGAIETDVEEATARIIFCVDNARK